MRAGRQRQSPTSWCRTSKGGSAVAACSRPGRSMRLRLPGNAARYQLCAMLESLGRQVKWASVRSLAESVPTGTSAARRRRPKRSLQCKRWPLRELLSCSSGGRRPWRLRPCQLQLHQQQALGGVQHQWLPVRFSRRRARRRGGHSSRCRSPRAPGSSNQRSRLPKLQVAVGVSPRTAKPPSCRRSPQPDAGGSRPSLCFPPFLLCNLTPSTRLPS